MNAALVHALDESGYGLVSSTRLQGRYAIRLCVLNHTSGPRDVLDVLSWLETRDVAVPAAGAVEDEIRAHPILERAASTAVGGVGIPMPIQQTSAARRLRRRRRRNAAVPRGHLPREARRTRRAHRASLGHRSRLLRDPRRRVEVFVDTRVVRTLGPGDFFGELAAQDWGGGFGYPRLADVIATAPLRLLVVPHHVYPAVATLPGLRDRIPGAVRVRLPES